ncbi:hypothetical protein PHMEG_00022321 [Phytophthora megakarya]|uniref:Uncharacterized protein n=1 Tax=Phytophthora megakarya TaxID=4795 RepID=A0A225VJH1_9STRA|nr:hypothetical protein PHMEG_00022321 [Phytophthora megakarya]
MARRDSIRFGSWPTPCSLMIFPHHFISVRKTLHFFGFSLKPNSSSFVRMASMTSSGSVA